MKKTKIILILTSLIMSIGLLGCTDSSKNNNLKSEVNNSETVSNNEPYKAVDKNDTNTEISKLNETSETTNGNTEKVPGKDVNTEIVKNNEINNTDNNANISETNNQNQTKSNNQTNTEIINKTSETNSNKDELTPIDGENILKQGYIGGGVDIVFDGKINFENHNLLKYNIMYTNKKGEKVLGQTLYVDFDGEHVYEISKENKLIDVILG